MIIIFDLDYTLLDTVNFDRGLAEILGMSVEDFTVSYNKYFKNRGLNYSLNRHLQILGQDDNMMSGRIADFIKSIDKYLVEDAEKILQNFSARGDKLVMLSFGDVTWQKTKLDNLSVKKYFSEIIYEPKDKTTALIKLKESYPQEKFVIINDKTQEIKNMKNILGDTCVQACAIKSRYSVEEDGYKIYNNIKELNQQLFPTTETAVK